MQLMLDTYKATTLTMQVPDAQNITAISSGAFHNMALNKDGEVGQVGREGVLWSMYNGKIECLKQMLNLYGAKLSIVLGWHVFIMSWLQLAMARS